ncbi:FAD-dependent oxidoreductase [Microbacterium sp. B2969]|uniref:FAD-dependent oxidoreductase n=1 Tax=Microbacterium alkaliflavum TaxID=3248839 RepID=A0ABW7QBD9_9MICO
MTDRRDVIVIGAGPSGLMAATCLARLGASVVVIDRKDGPTRESRALALQARSLEIFDQLGLSDEVAGEATLAPAIYPGYGTRVFHPVWFTDIGRTVTPFPGLHILEQSRNERLLRDAFLRLGGTILWQHAMTTVKAVESGVAVTAAAPSGDVELHASWCIAADGASSDVRKQLGIGFEGSTSPLVFFVADAVDASDLVPDAINMRVRGDDFMLTFPMGAPGHHRILGVIPADDTEDLDRIQARTRDQLRRQFAVEYSHASWFSSYRAHHRLASSFRQGHILLVGDAAHVHSPVGAQGMNTGLQDAHNLACKMAAVIKGTASEASLDAYEAERRPVAATLVRTTDAAFTRITSRGSVARFARNNVVPALAPTMVRLVPRIVGGGRLYGYLSQTRIHYRMPGARRGDHITGRRLPWTGDNYDVLRTFEWQVHGYGADPADVERTASAVGVGGHAFPADPHKRIPRGWLLLVRPDGFVAATTSSPQDASQLAGARDGHG